MKTIRYADRTYRLQSSGRYFQSDCHGDVERLLHRRIWHDAHGPIPAGHCIHHINGDWADNSIGNLQCMPSGQHLSAHLRERWADPEDAEKMRAQLRISSEKAKEWHASPAGRKWHSENATAQWASAERVDCVCVRCGSAFKAWQRDATLCSTRCGAALAYVRHRTATGNCLMCGAGFAYNKYRKQECCSRACGNRLRAQRTKNASSA